MLSFLLLPPFHLKTKLAYSVANQPGHLEYISLFHLSPKERTLSYITRWEKHTDKKWEEDKNTAPLSNWVGKLQGTGAGRPLPNRKESPMLQGKCPKLGPVNKRKLKRSVQLLREKERKIGGRAGVWFFKSWLSVQVKVCKSNHEWAECCTLGKFLPSVQRNFLPRGSVLVFGESCISVSVGFPLSPLLVVFHFIWNSLRMDEGVQGRKDDEESSAAQKPGNCCPAQKPDSRCRRNRCSAKPRILLSSLLLLNPQHNMFEVRGSTGRRRSRYMCAKIICWFGT